MKLLVQITVIAAIFTCTLFQINQATPQQPSKLGSSLIQELQTENHVNIIISLRDQTSSVLNQLNQRSFQTRTEKLNMVTSRLQEFAAKSQKEVLQYLNRGRNAGGGGEEAILIKSFWISNQISVKAAHQQLINGLAEMEQVSDINLDEVIPLEPAIYEQGHPGQNRTGSSSSIEWGIKNIQAPEAWAYGYDGSGVVIGTVDTGVRVTHETLARNYVGAENNGWYDALERTREPNDQDGHGTHTAGTIAGSNGIGVAPGVKWMACKGCDTKGCPDSALIECGQFMICPTKYDGTGQDCSKAPHIVSNSWGSIRGGNTFYNNIIEAYHAVGIIPVFAIGNAGEYGCYTVGSPGDQNVIGVGATNSDHALAPFSSKGPSAYGEIKPDFVAPGVRVQSAYHKADNSYAILSGTSMAAPHAAGVIALLVQAYPTLTFVQAKWLLYYGSDENLVPTGKACGGIPEDEFPNNSFGYGKVNAYYSVNALLNALKINKKNLTFTFKE